MNRIHPTAVVGPGVELGTGNNIGPHCVLMGPAAIGDDNWFGPQVVIGTSAQHRDAPHVGSWDSPGGGPGVVVGNHNVFHEFSSVHQPTREEPTRVGDGCFVMASAQISHDTHIEDEVTLSTSVSLGGHCRIGHAANLGLGVQVHQHVRIGPFAMIGMGSTVLRDVSPMLVATGFPARVAGINRVGLSRLGVSDELLDQLESALAEGTELPQGLPEVVTHAVRAWIA